jgi:hypothetical protein
MSKSVISAQNSAIKELSRAIETFVKGHYRTRVVPLAIPTGWGKTRIAVQGVLKADYLSPPNVVIWPQKHSHISNEVWLRCTDWCNYRKKACENGKKCTDNKIPEIKYIKPSKPGPITGRHETGAGRHSKKFKGTFYSVNNKFQGIKNALDKTKGPFIFIIDEWHSKKIIEKYDKSNLDPQEFWRDLFFGKESTRKLFVILISATPIGATSDMDSINSDESEGKFREEINDALTSFSKITSVGNQKRNYNLYEIYPAVINAEGIKLKKKQARCYYKYRSNNLEWIKTYISLSKKAYGNKETAPYPSTLIYSLESLLHSGTTHEIVKNYFKSLKSYFKNGFKRQIKTSKLKAIVDLLKTYPKQKFVIFCHYIAVAHSLKKYLGKNKIPSYYLEGDVKKKDNDFHNFNDDAGKIRVLIVTDEHSQGISLHKSKAWLIHFELSWNPIRIIQRYGRVWRIDRKSRKLTTPLAFYIPHAFSSEEEMIARLRRRWDVLNEISNSKEANFVNLAPISFEVALGRRCSPPAI